MKTKADIVSPLSPASGLQPVSSSQTCTSSPPVDWTSYKPECSRCVFSHLGKRVQMYSMTSFPVGPKSILDEAVINTGSSVVQNNFSGTTCYSFCNVEWVWYLKWICAGLKFSTSDRLLQQKRLVCPCFTCTHFSLLHVVILAFLCCTQTQLHQCLTYWSGSEPLKVTLFCWNQYFP